MAKGKLDSHPAKKRKYEDVVDNSNDRKRPKAELSEGVQFVRRTVTYFRRSAIDVLKDLLARSEGGDRQLALLCLREFSIEHLSTLASNRAEICCLLLKAAALSKYDTISMKLLGMTHSIVKKCSTDELKIFFHLLMSDEVYSKLFSTLQFSHHILEMVSIAIDCSIIDADDMPPKLVICMEKGLKSSSFQHRRSAIKAIVSRGLKRKYNFYHGSMLEKTLCGMTADRDSRVRRLAIDGIYKLSQSGAVLTDLSYKTAKAMLSDSNAQSRITCLRVLLFFGNLNPSKQVASTFGSGRETMLNISDDAFSSVCHCVNDMEVVVRTEAVTLLGCFREVSTEFLDQTLDKKLMKAMKNEEGRDVMGRVAQSKFAITKAPVQETRHSRGRWKRWQAEAAYRSTTSSGEWASGKDLNAPEPAGKPTDDSDSIIPQGACGAFVTALEDEFMSVRRAAVYSLGKLAGTRPGFATLALDHLADMFNDEMPEVRVDAINALTPLVVHGQLQKEQLDIILKCLDDYIPDSRQALRELLSKGEFADKACMQQVTQALINCLQRFPEDKELILACIAKLGVKHAVFVQSMVKSLLGLHPIFLPKEQTLEDPFYHFNCLLVLNAASAHEPIISMLPEYVLKHYRFLRAASPDMMPPIKKLDIGRVSVARRAPEKKATSEVASTEILGSTYQRLCATAIELRLTERNLVRNNIKSDALAISQFNDNLVSAAGLIAKLCDICSGLETIVENICFLGDIGNVMQIIIEEIAAVRNAQKQYNDVSRPLRRFLDDCLFHLEVLSGVVALYMNRGSDVVTVELASRIVAYKKLSTSPCSLCPAIEEILPTESSSSAMDTSASPNHKKIITPSTLARLITENPLALPLRFDEPLKVRKKWAKIVKPDKEFAMERPIRFVAGLATSFEMTALLVNLTHDDVNNVRIKICYPDNQVTYFKPRAQDLKPCEETATCRLETKVLLSSNRVWASAAEITLTLVLRCETTAATVALDDGLTSSTPCRLVLRLYPMLRASEAPTLAPVGRAPNPNTFM